MKPQFYYLPLTTDGYPLNDEAYEDDSIAWDAVCEYMEEHAIHRESFLCGYMEELTVTMTTNPYQTEYMCVDGDYDCDYDSDKGFHAISPYGVGATIQEAISNYIAARQ